MYCHKCGGLVLKDARFCENCGTPVTEEARDRQPAETSDAATFSKGQWSLSRLFTGRLGRLRYFAGGMFALVPFFVLVSLWGLINILTGTSSSTASGLVNVTNNIIIPILFAAAFIFWIAAYISLAIRRCHDFGYTGWFSLCALIPYAGAVFGLIILFKKGDLNANQYGAPPVRGRAFLADVFNY